MAMRIFSSWIALVILIGCPTAPAQMAQPRVLFRIKYVANGAAYLDGGSADGLAVGMKLRVRRDTHGAPVTARDYFSTVTVIAVASNSAACENQSGGLRLEVGDIAEMDPTDRRVVRRKTAKKAAETYAQVVSFTGDDNPLEAELRELVPKPPLPEVNRVKGMIAFDYSSILDHAGNGSRSSQEGLAFRVDMTRIGGTYWNFSGYWHGRRTITSSNAAQQPQTLSDLMNRTYHIGFTYNNPNSHNLVGVGRLLLPWASSLSTIDGGYYARRLGGITTLGIFAGSTPDPTAWNYDPTRQIGGFFTSFETGNYNSLHYVGTVGLAQSRLHRRPEKEFVFVENTLQVSRMFNFYNSAEIDYVNQGAMAIASTPAPNNAAVNIPRRPFLARSFLTLRFQPRERISFDLNHNYFKTVPTADARLIGTGLLDTVLFTGLNGGVRIRIFRDVSIYSNLGRNDQSQDSRPTWNYMYGLTIARMPVVNLRADLRVSRFNGSFGSGTYDLLSLGRAVGQNFQFNLQAGQQNFRSTFTTESRARFVNVNLDWFLSRRYVLGGGVTVYRGQTQNYDQWFFTLGYRF